MDACPSPVELRRAPRQVGVTTRPRSPVIMTESRDPRAARESGEPRRELLHGALGLLVLRTLADEPLHGWGIAKRLRERSAEVLQVGQGSLYPALYRLEDSGWVHTWWGVSPEGRRAKYYDLTPAGRRQLGAERESWRLFAGAMELVLRGA